jgi:hypothetical protein
VIADRLGDQGLEAFETDLNQLLEVIAGKLEDGDGAVFGERNIDRFGSTDRAAVEPLATGGG